MTRSSRRVDERESFVPERQRRLQHQFQVSSHPVRDSSISRRSSTNASKLQQQGPRRGGINEELEEVINAINTPRKLPSTSKDEDEIEEYIFSSDDEGIDENDNSYHSDAAQSHISVSSSESPGQSSSKYALSERPWLHMTPHERQYYEGMFVTIATPPIGDSWVYTEEYQLQIDALMIKYLQDFPLQMWAVGLEVAEQAFRSLQHRTTLRELGVRVYSVERLPEILRSAAATPHTFAYRPPQPYQQATVNVTPGCPTQYRPTPSKQAAPPHDFTNPQRSQRSHSSQALKLVQESPVDSAGGPKFNPAFAASILLAATDSRKKVAKAVSRTRQLPEDDDTDDDAEAKIRKHTLASISRARAATPPYPERECPEEHELALKPGKRHIRKKAGAEILPWHRQINFKAAKVDANWNDEYRNPQTKEAMARTRAHNAPIIERLDREAKAKYIALRSERKHRDTFEDGASSDTSMSSGHRKSNPSDKNDASDTYNSGSLSFATARDEHRANAVDCQTPDELVARGGLDDIDSKVLGSIQLCWRPGKKSSTHDLRQTIFTALESVLTRKQLAITPVLTWKAAECIIDYCPDLLWRETLLRICSESGMGNKDVRDRLCLNGYYTDKATFTKRISAALGQKHSGPKSKGYLPGGTELYESNSNDYDAYINFFGKRTTFRQVKAGRKRRVSSSAAVSSEIEDVIHVARKKPKLASTEASSSTEDVVMSDAVSIQDSDELDEMSD